MSDVSVSIPMEESMSTRCSFVSRSQSTNSVLSYSNFILVTDFINTLAQSSNLWQNTARNQNYCSWAQSFLNTPSKYSAINQGQGRSVIDRLKKCQPSNSQSVIPGGNKMPWLESTANGMKARAFGGSSSLRTATTFKRYSFSKKVFEIRAVGVSCFSLWNLYLSHLQYVAGNRFNQLHARWVRQRSIIIMSYHEELTFSCSPVADQFVQVSGCVKTVWSDFYTAYNAVRNSWLRIRRRNSNYCRLFLGHHRWCAQQKQLQHGLDLPDIHPWQDPIFLFESAKWSTADDWILRNSSRRQRCTETRRSQLWNLEKSRNNSGICEWSDEQCVQ